MPALPKNSDSPQMGDSRPPSSSGSSDTPETNKFRASLDGMREVNQRDQLLSHARKMERGRNRIAELREAEVSELREQCRSLKDQLAYLSKSKATEMLRLSDMIDKREEALGHIAAIMREKDENGEDLLIGSTAWKSVIRWSVYFQNIKDHPPQVG